ncbi:hypothetical protein BDW42DRAFT_175593 [Aspergillus taichungensis]|uniref:Uncharacterized protein n=1 Tax=Aspergillus taichungensis TaxID=482145 RepID=A0A2J5HLM9_9EURO|nr:hypothetical protein BDW42DRAFT_175593 [Aspergillus taichungensis]
MMVDRTNRKELYQLFECNNDNTNEKKGRRILIVLRTAAGVSLTRESSKRASQPWEIQPIGKKEKKKSK